MTETIAHWEELPDAVIDGDEQYSAVNTGWVNTTNRTEVVVFRTEETNLSEETSKKWAVAHPWEEDGNIMLRDNRDDAIEAAKAWMRANPRPSRNY